MVCGLVLTGEGFDDIQLNYTYYRLREDAMLVDVATPGGGHITGERGFHWEGTLPISELERDYDVIVVPGGNTTDRLRDDEEIHQLLLTCYDDQAIIAGIDTGVDVLLGSGLLDGRMVTGPPSLQESIEAAESIWTNEGVTVDGTIVTAQGRPCLSYFLPAIINNLIVPQSPASRARERPSWGTIE